MYIVNNLMYIYIYIDLLNQIDILRETNIAPENPPSFVGSTIKMVDFPRLC